MSEVTSVTGVGGNEMFMNTDKDIGGVSQQEFLQLLIAQLRHQDPMEPAGSQEFAAQLAQFTSLEELQELNKTTAQGVETNLMLAQTINNTMAATMIGKDVKAIGNSMMLEQDGEASLSFVTGGFSDNVTVTISDAAGQAVDTISMQSVAKGDHSIAWDALRDNGESFPPGEYSFSITATNKAGEEIATDPVMLGTIDAVRYSNAGAIFVVNGRDIPFSQVLELGNFVPDDEG